MCKTDTNQHIGEHKGNVVFRIFIDKNRQGLVCICVLPNIQYILCRKILLCNSCMGFIQDENSSF